MLQFKNRPKIDERSLNTLKKSKNLLAFSGGVDSSALFWILESYGIKFDIAMVDYGIREESMIEVAYAKELSKKFQKKLYLKEAKLNKNNFEHNARVFRYDFFQKIIKENGYNTLITAHQLDDKLEWFLMQFTKGAGVVELLGFDEVREREGYTLLRPLINSTKEELLNFLESNSIKYFIDKTNFDTRYKRNYFRQNFSQRLLKEFKEGITKSFNYLEKDRDILFREPKYIKIGDLYIFEDQKDETKNIRAIDKILKKMGYILSKEQKDEILRAKDVVISNRFVITFKCDKIYISPYIKIKLDKKFKEKCRVKKIPPKIRGYLLLKDIDTASITSLLYDV